MSKIDPGANDRQDRVTVLDDEKKRVLDLYTANLVPPSVGIFDEPTRCYRINKQWAAIVMGLASWLTEIAVWRDASDEGYAAIDEISKFLVGDDCMSFQLRQNPDNACVLDQSLDGGATWLSIFDFSLCQSLTDGSQTVINQNAVNTYNQTLNQFQNTIYNNYVQNYVSSITDIHPELGYGDADDAFRDNALCYSLSNLVDAICDSALQVLSESENVANDLKSSLALVGAVLGIFLLAGSGIGLPAAAIMASSLAASGIGIAAAVGAAIYDKFQEISEVSLTDESAKEELVCCLYGEMIGANADKADLEAAFTACTGLSDHANDIRELGLIYIQEMAFYAAFAENLTIAFQSAKLSLLPECPCSGEWCYELDLTLFTHWDFSINAGNQFAGTLAGSQWNTSDIQPGGSGKVRGIGVGYEFGFTTFIKRVEIDYSSDYGAGAGLKYSARFFLRMGTSTVYDSLNSGTQAAEGANLTFSRATNNPSCNQIRIAQVVDNTSGTLAGSGNITAVRVYGDGTNPFGPDNC